MLVDIEAREENSDGQSIDGSGSEDEEENEEDRKFINDEEEEETIEKVELNDSEYEIDDDDLTLIEDNRRAQRVSRIKPTSDSDSASESDDSFIDDDLAPIVVVPPPLRLTKQVPKQPVEKDTLDILVDLIEEEEKQEKIQRVLPPKVIQKTIWNIEETKPKREPEVWSIFKKQKVEKPAVPRRSSGFVRTADGIVFVKRDGQVLPARDGVV